MIFIKARESHLLNRKFHYFTRIWALELYCNKKSLVHFGLNVFPPLYLFSGRLSPVVFLTTGGLRDHWGGNPGDKSGAFVISSGSLWEMKTITQNKYFCQDKGPKHLGGRVVYKDGRSGPKISSGQCILLPPGDWHQWTGHQPYCTWRYRCIFFTVLVERPGSTWVMII